MSEINCDQIERSNFYLVGTIKEKLSEIRKVENQWLWKDEEDEGLGKDDYDFDSFCLVMAVSGLYKDLQTFYHGGRT